MLALLVSAAAEAQDTVFEDWEFSIRTDNDTLLDTDQYYSNGLWLNATKVQGDRWFGWGIANETYTASDIKLLPDQIPPDDRPYAGWTYLSYYRGRLDEEDAAVIWEFSAGCIGPCSSAQRFQNFWHSEVVDVPEAQGWDSQVTDEVGIQARRMRHKPLRYWLDEDRTLRADLERTTEFRMGNIVTDGKIGITGRLRMGNMRGYYDGAGLGELTPKRPVSRPESSPRPWVDRPDRGWLLSEEAFLFATIQGGLVLRDATLEGGLFNDDSPFTQDTRHAVIHTEIGFKIVWRRISFAMSWNSISTDWEGRSWELDQHNWISFYGVVH
jgi:hypothetical protein